MKQFKDLGITVDLKGFVGDKIKMDRVLNRQIVVHDYSIKDSKYDGKCLYVQLSINETMHVLFTGSKGLMAAIEKVPGTHFPFLTTIVKENEHYTFS